MRPPSESQEWLEQLVTQWNEVYKKSMATLVLLQIIRSSAPASIETIAPDLGTATGWEMSERALYRTLRRLAGNGLLATREESVPRTGAKRKCYELTDLGSEFLDRVEHLKVSLDGGSQARPTAHRAI